MKGRQSGTTVEKVSRLRRIAWVRVAQAVLAFIALLAADLYAANGLEFGWWLWVGVGTLISASLIEPHFTDSRTALANSVAAIGAAIGADRAGVGPLWAVFIGLAALVTVSSIVALVVAPSRAQATARWISSRFGRARLLGFSALLIEVVRVSSVDLADAVILLLGLAIAIAVSSLDWYRLLAGLPGMTGALATVEVATEPNLLLIATDRVLPLGGRVRIVGEGVVDGSVVAQMAHRSGSRFQIVLDKPWRSAVRHGNSECTVELLYGASMALGFAADGSTERVIEIHPLRDLTYGQPLLVRNASGEQVLYQVASLRLERNTWDNSSVIEPRGRAIQVGCVTEGGLISFRPYLPKPYQELLPGDDVAIVLLDSHKRIGLISGTKVEIGLNVAAARESHIAVLGMSGMGKTTVARRLCGYLSDGSAVVAIDGTGEYRSRLHFTAFDSASNDFTVSGEWVYEPAGDPPAKCRDFLRDSMTKAHAEYTGGGEPVRRTVLIEEAHSFLPEWNFATKGQSDAVAESCRFILQARKYGLGFVFVSQRTAVISKSALSQCESYVIFRTLDQTSLDYVEGVVGSDYREAVSSLGRYQAICVGPAFNSSSPVIVDIDPPEAVDVVDES